MDSSAKGKRVTFDINYVEERKDHISVNSNKQKLNDLLDNLSDSEQEIVENK